MYQYDVSIVILTYRPNKSKLKNTILSALYQKHVKMQIIITDDGSENNLFSEMKELFDNMGFHDYKLLTHAKNQGTCLNYYDGILESKGEYIKGISPGDYFAEEYSLYHWIEFMRTNQCRISFSDAIYYKIDNGKFAPIKRTHSFPIYKDIYSPKGGFWNKIRFIDYLVLFDNILGAAVLAENILLKEYCSRIINRIIYTEDSMYRLMLIDGIEILYYPQNAILYEFGVGISTSQNIKWREKLLKDQAEFNRLIGNSEFKDEFLIKYKKYIRNVPYDIYSYNGKRRNVGNIVKYYPISFLVKLMRLFYIKRRKSETSIVVNKNFLKKIEVI